MQLRSVQKNSKIKSEKHHCMLLFSVSPIELRCYDLLLR